MQQHRNCLARHIKRTHLRIEIFKGSKKYSIGQRFPRSRRTYCKFAVRTSHETNSDMLRRRWIYSIMEYRAIFLGEIHNIHEDIEGIGTRSIITCTE